MVEEGLDLSLWFVAEDDGEVAGIALCKPFDGEEGLGWVRVLGVRRSWRRQGLGRALLLHLFGEFHRRGFHGVGLGVDAESLTGAHRLYESAGMRVYRRYDVYEKALSGSSEAVSRLRAKCPDCRTFTAVALGPEYECHACGRTFAAGLVRVPRAWGRGGEAMAEAASLRVPYPEAAVIEEDSLAAQSLALALELPERPLVLGGCCCSHVGAVEALSARHGRIAVVWLDAHGDLNTVESSPSGNAWGMPLRMLLDSGAVQADDVALVGARNLDPPEVEFIAANGVGTGHEAVASALEGTGGAYVAVDFDALTEDEVAAFMPEPGGLSLEEAEQVLADVRGRTDVLGTGLSGLVPDERNLEPARRLTAALGL